MSLLTHWNRLSDELEAFSELFRQFVSTHGTITTGSTFTVSDECQLEGLLSRSWQEWNEFCRSIVIDSCIGSIDGNGAAILPVAGALSEAHVSSAAIRAASGKAPASFWTSTNSVRRFEPTWGDTDLLVKILPLLQPSNRGQLLASFSGGHTSAKALQKIRNATAHFNPQTLADVRSMRSSYIAFPITHPTHALFWTVPSTNNFLILHCLNDLVESALEAIA